MLFNTWPFAVFLLIFLPVFFALRKTRLWLPWLTLGSYCFYGWANPYFLLLILYVTAVVYFVARMIDRCPAEGQQPGALRISRGVWLVIGLLNTLAPLLFFKYARFIIENCNAVLSWVHAGIKLPDPSTLMPFGLQYLLPIGISFFTFQSLSYLIDLYLEKTPCERNLLRLANFVCFFPTLLMGPIERAGHLLPQFRQFPAVRLQNFTDGLSLFLVGLFKKMALAGYLAIYVARVYDNPKSSSALELMLATIAFGWQLFFDFSGYTDMARGVARAMGFNLVLNFNHPYLATGLGDFWRRWHISFTRWILDYIFMPLQLRWRDWRFLGKALAVLATFLVSGLWHGAAWTFVICGALHGLGLALTLELERSSFYRKRVPKIIKQAWVFVFVSIAWIFFRAGSLEDALLIIGRICIAAWHSPLILAVMLKNGILATLAAICRSPQIPMMMVALVCMVWLYEFLCESKFRDVLKTGFVRVGIAVFMALFLLLSSSGGGAFIYLKF
ncbi:MAG: MBOAT family protein [Candidatus Sumerlaeota bacterium]|nr:MBOAT family protein [Candidatus Sumerlaeota bacterium]